MDEVVSAPASSCFASPLLRLEFLLLPFRLAVVSCVQRCIRLDGIGAGTSSGEVVEAAGRRNGRAPFGDAWLLDDTVTKGMFLNLIYAWPRISSLP